MPVIREEPADAQLVLPREHIQCRRQSIRGGAGRGGVGSTQWNVHNLRLQASTCHAGTLGNQGFSAAVNSRLKLFKVQGLQVFCLRNHGAKLI